MKGVLWSGASQIVRRGANLGVTIVLARLLSPDTVGLVALATLFVGVANVVTDLGFSFALVQRKELEDEHLAAGFWVSLALSTVLAASLALSAPLLAAAYAEPRVVPVLRMLVLAMPIGALGQISSVLLQRRLDFQRVASIDFAGTVVSGLTGIAMAWLGAGVWALVGQALALAIATLLGRQIAAPYRPRNGFSISRARELSAFGLTVVVGSLVNFAAANVDNAIVGGALGTATLGSYALAYNLVVLPGATVGGLVSGVMFPALSQVQDDLPRFRRGYLRMLRVLSLCTIPSILGMWATAPELIGVIYGSKWGESAPILRGLLVVGLLHGVNVSGNVFYAMGKPGIILRWAIVSVGIMTIGLLIGVRYGVLGLTLAYSLVSPIVLLVPHLLANRLLSLPIREWLRAVAPSLLGGAAMLAVVVTLARAHTLPSLPPLRLTVLVIVGALSYGAVLLLIAFAAGARSRGMIHWLLGGPGPLRGEGR